MNGEQSIAVVRESLAVLFGCELTEHLDDQPLIEVIPDKYDSLGVLDCVATVERRFGISIDLIDDDLVSNFRSVRTISALVERKLHDARVMGSIP